ncbi:MAG: phenylacetate--CoA ligase family protein [Rhodobacteraceae bacterium]|nr:MAG: phenylacetate--CoA ligase family protein [Paracoccaceae bacterium]
MADHYDALETRSADEREHAQFECLRAHIAASKRAAPAVGAMLADVDPEAVTDRAALARLPVLRKSALGEAQKAAPPLGGFAAGFCGHVFMSPGPIFEPGGVGHDWWRFGRALHAAGLRKGDLLHNCFAYHLTPAGMMIESGARAVGAAVFPGGVGNTEAQVQAAAHLRPGFWAGTPDFLKVILDKAPDLRADLSSITRALVSGGALFPSLRQEYADRGVSVLQCYATADLGLVAYESPAQEGMLLDESVIVEIVRPGTGDPVAEGEVGEVVVTALNADYPLIRFATGDLSAMMPGASPCGRTGPRIRGWMGRADQTAKIKGMFVRPEQIATICDRHKLVMRARLTITRDGEQDAFEIAAEAPDVPDLASAVAATARDVLKLSGAVRIVPIGSLPNDGKVIDDQRKYD